MAGSLPDEVNLERLAKLLGVDELMVVRSPMDPFVVKTAARLGTTWMSADIKMSFVEDAKNSAELIGQQLFDLARDLKQSVVSIEYASGKQLDVYAEMLGLKREPEPEPTRPQNRFEAVVEEMKKL